MAFILILSPNNAPPVFFFEGSTETIAIVFSGKSIKYLLTNSSTVDDFPEPPVPVIPNTGTLHFILVNFENISSNSLCLFSAIDQQTHENEIIVVVDGFIEESQEVLDKYKDNIKVLDLGSNQGMQSALNLAVMNATNEKILIVNDDNVFSKDFDLEIEAQLKEKNVLNFS